MCFVLFRVNWSPHKAVVLGVSTTRYDLAQQPMAGSDYMDGLQPEVYARGVISDQGSTAVQHTEVHQATRRMASHSGPAATHMCSRSGPTSTAYVAGCASEVFVCFVFDVLVYCVFVYLLFGGGGGCLFTAALCTLRVACCSRLQAGDSNVSDNSNDGAAMLDKGIYVPTKTLSAGQPTAADGVAATTGQHCLPYLATTASWEVPQTRKVTRHIARKQGRALNVFEQQLVGGLGDSGGSDDFYNNHTEIPSKYSLPDNVFKVHPVGQKSTRWSKMFSGQKRKEKTKTMKQKKQLAQPSLGHTENGLWLAAGGG